MANSIPSIFDPSYGAKAVISLTKDHYDKLNQSNIDTYNVNAKGWYDLCVAKGMIVSPVPIPPLRWHVSDTGDITSGPDYVCDTVKPPVFELPKSDAGKIAANTGTLTNEQHFQLIEAMLREIYSKLLMLG